MLLLLFSVTVLLLGGINVSEASCDEVYFTLSRNSSPDHENSCMTLSQIAEQINITIGNNMSLIFAEGHHILNASISVSKREKLFISAMDDSVSITCSDNAHFKFSSIDLVFISNLTFISCGNNKIEFVKRLIIKWSTFTGGENTTTGTLVSIVESNAYIDATRFSNGSSTHSSQMSWNHSEVFRGTKGGAMIVMNSSITINNSMFEANCASIGGALYFGTKTNITISNCVFTFNHAVDCLKQYCLGGALFVNETSRVIITNSTFENNTSDKDGGVAVVFNATLLVSNGNFLKTKAKNRGGIVAAFQHSVLVFNTSSLNSSTANNGGAIYLDRGSLNFSGCRISNNEAHEMGGVLFMLKEGYVVIDHHTIISNNTAVNGGVIHVTNTDKNNIAIIEASTISGVKHTINLTITISNSIFSNNEASLNGGVLSSYHSCTCIIRRSKFFHNTAGGRGGAISMSGSKNSANILNSNFSLNTATIFGGVASLEYGGNLFAGSSLFETNVANVHGGVFDSYSLGNITVSGSIFFNNSADTGGGVVNIKKRSTFFVTNSHFFNNTDSDLGAIILAIGGNIITISYCNFTRNSASYGGVLIATWNNSITISDSIFHHNRAASNGGTIYTRRKCKTIVSNCSFTNNTAVNDGITIAADSSMLQIEETNFSYNLAGHDGGVVYAYDNSNVNISNCHLKGNRAENSGGVIYGLKNSTTILNNSICEWNSAQNSGGGVHAQKYSRVIIEASNFTKNTADYGGAVHVYVKSVANIRNCNFRENRANVAGGSLAVYENGSISVLTSNFTLNLANVGGVAIAYQGVHEDRGHYQNHNQRNEINFNGSNFMENTANHGGALYIQGSHVTVTYNSFVQNCAKFKGGVIHATTNSSICIDSTNFTKNWADNDGGVMILIDNSDVHLNSSEFVDNRAKDSGGIMHLYQSKASVFRSRLISSHAGINGGVLVALNSSVSVKESCFMNNSADNTGGAMDAYTNSKLTVENSYFLRNKAQHSGGSLFIAVDSSGSIIDSIFELNVAIKYGGAISALSSSKITIIGCKSSFSGNTAEIGGALSANKNSSISFNADDINVNSSCEFQIQNNVATESGGGVYTEKSDLYFISDTRINISFNRANKSGGGLHAVNSSIYFFNSDVVFYSNNASQYGGGISLANSKFYDAKVKSRITSIVNFMFNCANEGGAIYVDDENESALCSNNPFKGIYSKENECFFQNASSLNIKFFNNSAATSGNSLFGGLLDRCIIVSNNILPNLEPRGVSQFIAISDLTSYNGTISSGPVSLCLCRETTIVDCGQRTTTIQVKMNDSFSFYIVAVDQVNKTVAATVRSSFRDISLEESETIRRINTNCSKLKYHVPFPHLNQTYKLTIYPEGPCGNKSISMMTISIHAIDCTCPPGFMRAKSDTKCECVCDKRDETFAKYISECNITSRLVTRKGSFWISYFENSENNTSPYFIYPHCPLDYCQQPSKAVTLNLSLPNGSDSQCANNRGGMLCGQCLSNYSLSLGSSRCIECPDRWYGILILIIIAAFLAGITLVVALLILNLTVAIGTLNSIVFYANIIYANRNIYFSHPGLGFASVFISWLNLNIGFDVCFIKGMDSYTKTWLELAFPTYIIILVIVIISVSSHSSKFSYLLGKKNPVATLATLILLSYTKLLETIIVSFSFIRLDYPNGTVVTKWLPDANTHFTGWKHAALTCMGIFILILGLLYTILIFSWQWLLRCSAMSKLFWWTRNQKLHLFIDIHHTPYTTKHRYWTGLLLLIRVIVYLVSTFTISVDPRISILSTAITMCCLLTYKTLLVIPVYKHRLLNIMESCVHLNIAIFAVITLCTLDDPTSEDKDTLQRTAGYVSAGVILVILLLVLVYHTFRYASLKVYTMCQNSNFVKKFKNSLEYRDRERGRSDRNSYNLLDFIDDPREMEGYTAPPLHLRHGPTVSTTTVSMSDSIKPESP